MDMSEVVVADTERWTYRSAVVDASYRVTLTLPPRRTEAPIPVLVMLDGETMILTATEFLRTLNATASGIIGPVALVAVMAEAASGLDYVATRFRDFTPVEWTLPGPFAGDNMLAKYGTGGADKLIAAIVDEIVPQARARVRHRGYVDEARVGICGWSLAGLCVAHAWVSRPDVFADLVAISPSLWWHHAAMLEAPIAPRPLEHHAIITAGQHEEGDPSLVWPQRFADPAQREMAAMVRNAERFGEQVSASGATTYVAILAQEHHMTLVPASLARALVRLYG